MQLFFKKNQKCKYNFESREINDIIDYNVLLWMVIKFFVLGSVKM